jgi:hypothetical protein
LRTEASTRELASSEPASREYFDDQRADITEFTFAKAARRCCGCAKANAGGDEWLFGIKRNSVFVAGDPRSPERTFRPFPSRILFPKINEHQVVVSAARHDIDAALDKGLRQARARSRPPVPA